MESSDHLHSLLDSLGYRNIFDSMNEGIWVGDEHERTIYANPNFCALMGYSLEEMIWKSSYDFWGEKDLRVLKKHNALRKHGKASKYEAILRSKDGEKIPVRISGTPIGKGGTAAIMTDLRELEAVKEHAKRAEMLNTLKDEFVSVMSHELRTPMTGIKGYTSMLIDGDAGVLPKKALRYLEVVFRETERLLGIVNDMLAVAKLDAETIILHETYFDPNELLREIHELLLPIPRSNGLDFFMTSDPNIKTFWADREKIRQVAINFLGNAFKFTQAPGTVEFFLEMRDPHKVCIGVRDTWVGIPEEKREAIFEKFWQVDNHLRKSIVGTGLGLYICKKIVEASWGMIEVESKIGKGSTFRMIFPVQEVEDV